MAFNNKPVKESGAPIPRRSIRSVRKPDKFYRERAVKPGVIEMSFDERRGLDQPGRLKRSLEDELLLEKQNMGRDLFRAHLKASGWNWHHRVDGTIYRAPRVAKSEEIENVNMFKSYEAIYAQFIKDGGTMDQIFVRAEQARSTVENTETIIPHSAGLTSKTQQVPTKVEDHAAQTVILVENKRSICDRLDRLEMEVWNQVLGNPLHERLKNLEEQLGFENAGSFVTPARLRALEECLGL